MPVYSRLQPSMTIQSSLRRVWLRGLTRWHKMNLRKVERRHRKRGHRAPKALLLSKNEEEVCESFKINKMQRKRRQLCEVSLMKRGWGHQLETDMAVSFIEGTLFWLALKGNKTETHHFVAGPATISGHTHIELDTHLTSLFGPPLSTEL